MNHLLLAIALVFPAFALADTNVYVNHQGRLLDTGDNPAAGAHKLAFKVFASPVKVPNEQALWSAEYDVVVSSAGAYAVQLGNVDGNRPALGASIFTGGDARYLAIAVDGGQDLEPRQLVSSVPLALVAKEAGKAKALDCVGCVTAAMLAEGTIPDANPANFAKGSVPLAKIDRFQDGKVDADSVGGVAIASTSDVAGRLPVLDANGRLPASMLPAGVVTTTGGNGVVPKENLPANVAYLTGGLVAKDNLPTDVAYLEADGRLATGKLADGAQTWRTVVDVTAQPGVDVTLDHTAFPSTSVALSVWAKESDGTFTLVPPAAVPDADPLWGSGRDGDLTLSAAQTYNIEDYVPGYDGVARVGEFRNVTLTNGATLTARGWNGLNGGRLVLRALGKVEVCATCKILADGLGFRGGRIFPANSQVAGVRGEGPGGGSGAMEGNTCGHGGGGGGGSYGTEGADGTPDVCRCPDTAAQVQPWRSHHGWRGPTYGDAFLTGLPLGSGGASGSDGHNYVGNAEDPGVGGNGGGAIGIWAPIISNLGTISANGAQGTPISTATSGKGGWTTENPQVGSGGAGSGGSILLVSESINAGIVKAQGGPRGSPQNWPGCTDSPTLGQRGGAGGDGRVRIEYETAQSAITTTPTAVTQVKQFDAPKFFGYSAKVVDSNKVTFRSAAAVAREVRLVLTAVK